MEEQAASLSWSPLLALCASAISNICSHLAKFWIINAGLTNAFFFSGREILQPPSWRFTCELEATHVLHYHGDVGFQMWEGRAQTLQKAFKTGFQLLFWFKLSISYLFASCLFLFCISHSVNGSTWSA